MREPTRQDSIATECEKDARRTQDVARDETDAGNCRGREQQKASGISQKNFRGFGQWSVFMKREIGPERSLSDELNENVEPGR